MREEQNVRQGPKRLPGRDAIVQHATCLGETAPVLSTCSLLKKRSEREKVRKGGSFES